jgi:Outer membrane protein beta-barrel domain
MESKRFEESFRNAFDGAEIAPSASVWTNVELDLEKATGGKIKRNLIMFQLLAAASTVFALGIGAMYYLNTQPVNSNALTSQTQNQKAKEEQSNSVIEKSAEQNNPKQNQAAGSEQAHVKESSERAESIKRSNKVSQVTQSDILLAEKQTTSAIAGKKVDKADLASLLRTNKPVLILPKADEPVAPDAGMLLLAQLKDKEKKYQEEDKKKASSNEKIWTSVGLGAGSYKPKASSGMASLTSGDRSVLGGEEVSGASYSASVNVAGKVSKRLIVQGGVSYLTQSADFTSTAVINGNASLNEFVGPSNFEKFQSTTPYTVNSNLQFISIPVQAGYLVIDRDFAIQVNGGVSTDFFIRNTLTAETGDYEKVTQSAGSDSPYRTVNFSGLLGTEFSYRIADRYRISLNPGLRYSINSIYKSDVAAEIAPVTYDVSLRFRYIFK